MNYNYIINKVSKNKYQNYLNLDKKFFISYIHSRSSLIKKLNKFRYIKSTGKQKNLLKKGKNNKIEVYNTLYLIFEEFIKNKKIKNQDCKKIINFYHKFETNLILRVEYNKDYKRTTNKKANLNAYVLLSFFIRKMRVINSLQKINCIIKINDYLIIKKFKPANDLIKKMYLQNIKYEIDYILKINKS
tara:strand:- start:12878 stop:13441 length:564 start_codon:yes stop_codon:yes gene_type:complete